MSASPVPLPQQKRIRVNENRQTWSQAVAHFDAYQRYIFGAFNTMNNDPCIPTPYAKTKSVVEYRYNTINWACKNYNTWRMSVSTFTFFVELLDMFLSKCKQDLISFDTMQDHDRIVFQVTLSFVLLKVAMDANEDECILVTSKDINTFFQQNGCLDMCVNSADFIECEKTLLNTLNFVIWNPCSPAAILEAFLSVISPFMQYGRATEHEIFMYYCRYVFNMILLDYEVLTNIPSRLVILSSIALARMHWPINVVSVFTSNIKYHTQCEYKYTNKQNEQRPWLDALADAGSITVLDILKACKWILTVMDAHGYHSNAHVPQMFAFEKRGHVHQIGFPTLKFFNDNNVMIS